MDPLKQELLKPEYQGLTDQEAANAIMAKTVEVRLPVATSVVKQAAIEAGYYADIEVGCESSNPQLRRLCINVRGWIDDAAGKMKSVDMDSPASQTMIAGLIAFQIITEEQANYLQSLSKSVVKWVDYEGIGIVGVGLVKNARK